MIRAGVLGLILMGLPALVSKDLPHVDPGDRCMMAIVAEGEEILPIEPELVEEPEEEIQEPVEAAAPEPMHLWQVCTITHYCWCEKCNGRAGHPTASGVNPTVNHTVACGDLPFGTRLMINGQEYVVEDRGVSGAWVDIFVGSHGEALARGMFQAEVYIIG